MRIVFHSLRMKNFLSTGNQFETFPLDKNDFTVIVGSNGSGKSTIIDALSYVLYKRAYRPKLKLGQLINNTNKKNMLVEVAFTAGNDTYIVRRGEKPKIFEIYKNKELMQADPSVNDMQAFLEEGILQQNFKTFSQINVISKVSYTEFMELTPADRRNVVENILDTNIYSVMQSLGKNDLKILNEEAKDIEGELRIIENNISTTRSLIAQYQNDKQEEIKRYQDEITEEEESLSKYQHDLAHRQRELEEAKEKLNNIIPTIHLDKVDAEILSMTTKIGEYTSIINRATDINSKIDMMEECPHCLQLVDESHKTFIVDQNKVDINEAQLDIDKIEQKLNGFKARRNNYKQQEGVVRDIESSIRETESNIRNTETSINRIKAAIDRLQQPNQVKDLPDVDKLIHQQTKMIEKRDELITKINNLKQAIQLLGDDGIKAHMIAKYIPIINQKINEFLERMNMFVEFTLDSEFNETISAINRDLFTYHSFSQGQKQRIDLAILLTWRYISRIRNSMSTNLFFMDEIADGSMDSQGMEEFFSILKDLSDAQNTFLISHKSETQDLFSNVIHVEMDGNFSRYTHE